MKTIEECENFKAEATKDILCAVVTACANTSLTPKSAVSQAIKLADELITQLKEQK